MLAASTEPPRAERQEPRWVRSIVRLAQVGSWASGACVILMGINVIVDVLMRNIARAPLPGTLDLVTYVWMPCLALLALGWAQIQNEQIRVTLLVDSTSVRARRRQAAVGEAICAVVGAWMAYLAVQEAIHSYTIVETTIGLTWLPLWPVRVVVALSFSIYALSAVARIYRILSGERLMTEIEQGLEVQNDNDY